MALKIIAEIGINHNGDFRLIEELVRQAAENSADYAKFQLYDSVRVFGDDSRKRNEFTRDQVFRISEFCRHYEIKFLASVFDEEKLAWCEDIGVEAYKIASRTVTADDSLCRAILEKNKTTYVSLGSWIDATLLPHDTWVNKWTSDVEYANIRYMNCTSRYPTHFDEHNRYRPYGNLVVGYSDHAYGLGSCLYQIAMGADVIEKHFTLDKTLLGNDHICSMIPAELRQLRIHGSSISRARKETNE